MRVFVDIMGGIDMRYFPKKIEEKWRKWWLKDRTYEPDLKRAKKPYYNLMMFPYPSAEGLHIGSVRTFSGIDIYGRFKRMQGHDVFEPIGLDGFGIHSENYALKVGKHPFEHAKDSEKNFYRQLSMIGNGFAWEEKLETYDPKYYKWTQWIFTEMFKHGLAYRKNSAVNWCPSCKTVLADEQVLHGECERCQSKVEKKDLEQWFFKITDYAERLLKNLDKIDWPEPIKIAQRNWIGKSEGAEIDFEVKTQSKPNFVLLHGYGGSPEKDFLPWLKKELISRGYKVQVPTLPHADKSLASEKNDMEALSRDVKFDTDTVLLGHSLGAIVALKALEKLEHPIRKLILVGGFLEPKFRDHDRDFTNTFSWKFNFKKIKENAGSISILHDVNDHAIPYDQGEKLFNALGGELSQSTPTKSHFNGDQEPSVLDAMVDKIKVFTTRPDTLFGATYVVAGPEHPLIQNLESRAQDLEEVREYAKKAKEKTDEERIAEGKEKTGVELKGIKAINPANGEEIPVWVADYVLGNVGTGAIMAVPAHDRRDWEFARKYNLPIKEVVCPTYGNEKDGYEYRRTISAIVRRKSDGKFLALKWKNFGWITPPIGGIDKGETPEEAAVRELFEETGFKARVIERLGGEIESHYFADHKNEWRKRLDQPVLMEILDEKPEEISDEEKEKHDIIWLSPEEVVQKIMYDNNKLAYERYLQKNYAFVGEGKAINSGFLDGLPTQEAKKKIIEWLGKNNFGKKKTTFRLRDWLISRQRYWGPPIPMIYCEKCGWQSVPEKDLPVKLPYIEDFQPRGKGQSPLASVEKFYKVRCPGCKSWARRETDVSDTFLDSAWYYLRYPSVKDNKSVWTLDLTQKWLPVDMYIGGAEHAVLHLLYSRFVAMAFHDWGKLHFEEPFKKFRTHGLITKDGAKMSKSRGNVVNPDEYINAYGSDAIRMYLAFLAPLTQGGDFRDEGIKGITRFLERVYNFSEKVKDKTSAKEVQQIVHKTIKKGTEDVESFQYNTAISSLMILLNEFEKSPEIGKREFEIFLKLLAPLAPHITEELWFEAKGKPKKYKSIHLESWPKYDSKLIREETFELIIQVNGKVRGKVTMPIGTSETEAKKAALAKAPVKQHIPQEPKKVIFVPNKLINFVV